MFFTKLPNTFLSEPKILASMKRIRTRNIRTAAVPKPRAIIVGSGDFTNWKIAKGSETIGPLVGSKFMLAVKPEVRRTGEVSPIPLAVAKIIAVVSPDLAVGRVTIQAVLQAPAPKPREASFKVPGTILRTTSDALIMIGSIITLIARAAAKPDF
jgi:hypothetical protein